MMPFRFLPEAASEYEAAAVYYENERAGLGVEFESAVSDAIKLIREHPLRWPMVRKRLRRYRLDRFPYWIVYRVDDDAVEIVAVAHGSRRPGYWRDRL